MTAGQQRATVRPIDESNAGFDSELRVSSKFGVVALVVLSAALVFISEFQPNAGVGSQLKDYAFVILAASVVCWLIISWDRQIGQWLLIVVFAGIIYLGDRWMSVPGLLTLLVVPTALAAALIGVPAAVVTTIGETALLLLPKPIAVGTTSATITALLAIWGMLGVMYATYRPVHRVSAWAWEYYRHAQHSLKEARDRQADLRQALEDLADANLQLTRLNMIAHGLRQAAEEARIAKQQFVANVSHELRTPLNMILGFSEMVVEAPESYGSQIPSPLIADLAVIQRNAQHLADLIDDVLDMSQIESTQMALSRESVNLHEIVAAAVGVVRPLYASKGLYLDTTIQEGLPSVLCDRLRIREVLLNLLSNAGRFTEDGGVRVHVSQQGSDIVVQVADTGPGITEDGLRKLFQPFQQVDGSIRRRYGGTGLGLAISKHFIELHGGEIWVESEQGSGTTFSFRLPVAPSLPADDSFARWLVPDWEYLQRTRPSAAPQIVVRPRFVVLETGHSLQRLLKRYLDGAEIVPAYNWGEAIQRLSESPSQALLINDINLGSAFQRLRATPLPYDALGMVCFVPGPEQPAGALGVSSYLVKPISRDTLLAALDHLELDDKTILIVDDEPEALRLFRRMLDSSQQGYRVLRARDGLEAMDLAREHRPDAILLDLAMPNMDGFEFLEAKSQDQALKDIPVIMTTARDPAGQPIVCNALTVTRGDGLSIHQLLTCIKTTCEVLSPIARSAAPAPTAVPPD